MSDIETMMPHSGRFLTDENTDINVVDGTFSAVRAAPIISSARFVSNENVSFTSNVYKCGVWWDITGLSERTLLIWINAANSCTMTVTFYFNTTPYWGTASTTPIAHTTTTNISCTAGTWTGAIISIPAYAPYVTFSLTRSADSGTTTVNAEGYGHS